MLHWILASTNFYSIQYILSNKYLYREDGFASSSVSDSKCSTFSLGHEELSFRNLFFHFIVAYFTTNTMAAANSFA